MGVNGLSRSDDFSRILNWSFEGREAGLRLEQLQIHDGVTFGDLTRRKASLKYREIPAKNLPLCLVVWRPSGFMNSKSTSLQSCDMKQPCKHPRVQIVSRDEDSEFVECKECGEIFESSEFKDMNIEERAQETEI